MHPFLRIPYAVAARAADAIARLPLSGDGKLVRSLRARRDAVERLVHWAQSSRDPSRPLVWIHAPSVGEGLQARPVLERLRTQHPDWQLLYTFFSPSAERFGASLNVDMQGYLPFDRRRNAARVLEALQPSAIVFSKLDVWPQLTEEAARRGIPVGLIAATMSELSGRRGPLARALSRDAFASLRAVGAIDPADADRLVDAGVARERITLTGDTRYDQVAARALALDREAPLLRRLRAVRPTLVAGSTWPADEKVLLAAWRAVQVAVPEARLIIAPHEPTPAHLEPIERWASEAKLSFATLDRATPDHQVVLVDRVGVLGDLYALSDAAFVGGGFHAAGLHSVLEPASFGVPVLFGPRYHGSRDARILYECRGAEPVHDVAELARALRILFTEDDTRARAGDAALATVREGIGAAERSLRLVERLVAAHRGK